MSEAEVLQKKAPDAPAQVPQRKPKVVRYLVIGAIVLGAVALSGIMERHRSDAELAQWTDEQAIPSVDVETPRRATDEQHLTLPATIQAFYTAPIHARVNGYVRMWYFDIGARVKAGTVLAKIDTPELDQQYAQAQGELAKSKADYSLAVTTADRWKALRASQAVSQQTADEKASEALARKAEVSASQANVDRLGAMEAFKDITAPFDGIVTARRIDVGALVSATNSNQPGLFDVAATKKMRVYVQVPQVYAAQMRKGMKVTLRLPQYTDKTFSGTLDTTADAISEHARSLLVEAMFENTDGLLAPGAYAQARFDLPLDPSKLTVPASALVFRNENPEVATVVDDKVKLKKVTILRDTGNRLEIGSGLTEDDQVVVSPSDSIADGDQVKVERANRRSFNPGVIGKTADKPGSQDASR